MLVSRAIVKSRLNRCLSTLLDSAKIERKVAVLLGNIVEPVTGRPLVEIGAIQSIKLERGGLLKADLDLFVPGYVPKTSILEQCESALRSHVPEVKDFKIRVLPARKYGSVSSVESSALSNVGHVIGVSSCKGGVGKSTVAVNLALSLAKKGLKVAILDADIYGPSLPHLLSTKDSAVLRSPTNPKHILPLESSCGSVKMLSFGHVNPKSGAPGSGGQSAAVVRGPIVSKIINQLILSTEWGDLDYLIVDMPPGTGDIQITLTQSVSLTGAVIVTTPHTLSLVDAAKGVAMFEDLKVPTLAVVENMSHFTCDHGTKYYPFGKGGREKLLSGLGTVANGGAEMTQQQQDTQWRLQRCPLQSIPLVIDPENIIPSHVSSNRSDGHTSGSSVCSDAHCTHDHHSASSSAAAAAVLSMPIVLREPQSESAAAFSRLAEDVINEVFRSQAEAIMTPSVSYNEKKRHLVLRYFSATHAEEFTLPIEELRLRDPLSGSLLIQRKFDSKENRNSYSHLTVVKLDFKGKYGVAPVWSDGHYADIFPYHVLKKIAQELKTSDRT